MKVVEWLPSTQLPQIAELLQAGGGPSGVNKYTYHHRDWAVIAVIKSIILFKKRTKHE